MKKYIFICISIVIILIGLNKRYEESSVIIPSSAIRFRIIANSDDTEDQELKLKVRDNLSTEVASLLQDKNDINSVRKTLIQNQKNLENNVSTTLRNNNSSQDFTIDYGMNYFPKKEFKGVEYKEGKYESLVVTLGQGSGQNWWCVLFPPLCLLEAEETQTNDTEYKFFVKEIIDDFMSNN